MRDDGGGSSVYYPFAPNTIVLHEFLASSRDFATTCENNLEVYSKASRNVPRVCKVTFEAGKEQFHCIAACTLLCDPMEVGFRRDSWPLAKILLFGKTSRPCMTSRRPSGKNIEVALSASELIAPLFEVMSNADKAQIKYGAGDALRCTLSESRFRSNFCSLPTILFLSSCSRLCTISQQGPIAPSCQPIYPSLVVQPWLYQCSLFAASSILLLIFIHLKLRLLSTHRFQSYYHHYSSISHFPAFALCPSLSYCCWQ